MIRIDCIIVLCLPAILSRSPEVLINRHIGTERGVDQCRFLLPGMAFANPPAVRYNGNDIPALCGPQIVFSKARDIEDNFVGADHARQQPCPLLLFLEQPTQDGFVEVGLDLEQAV